MYDYNHAAAARIIRAHRLNLRMTQEDVAARMHIDRSYYGRIERGRVVPTLSMLLDICNELDMDPMEIITRS